MKIPQWERGQSVQNDSEPPSFERKGDIGKKLIFGFNSNNKSIGDKAVHCPFLDGWPVESMPFRQLKISTGSGEMRWVHTVP